MDMKSSDDDEVPLAKRMLKGSSRSTAIEAIRFPVEGQYVDQAERDRLVPHYLNPRQIRETE